jgi:hypothetical protein
MILKPTATDPELLELLNKAKGRWEAMSPEERREQLRAQRRSWVIGEMMLEHPDMTRERAEQIFDQMI